MHIRSAMLMVMIAAVLSPGGAQRILAQADRSRPYREPYRLQFHFSPPRNWINDPNGLVYHDGAYHLFYQYNPFGDTWGHMSWGHAVSPDLVHWQHLPVALAEEDDVMIWSGSAVVDWQNTSGFGAEGEPPLVAIYTGRHNATNIQAQHLAFSTDGGRTWTKYAGNPVLDLQSTSFRDPKVLWHAPTERWVMAVALPDDRKVRFYGSPDLKQWTHLSDFGPAGAVGGVWECPDLFELPVEDGAGRTRWVLEVDLNPGAVAGGSGGQYFVGTFDGTTFHADRGADGQVPTRWVDYGKDFYAAVSWSDIPDADGRRIWLGWLNNWAYAGALPTHPWRGAQSIPRVLSLREASAGMLLIQRPVAELQQLRGSHVHLSGQRIHGSSTLLADAGLSGKALEILAEFEVEEADEVGLKVRVGPGEETVVGFDAVLGRVFVDRRRSGRVDFHEAFPGVQAAAYEPEGGVLRLHLFVDWSSIEVFAGDGAVSITDRIFPSPESDGLALYTKGGAARLRFLDIWALKTIWEE